MTKNFRGALLMLVCMAAFVVNDGFVRLAGQSLPLIQILFLRGCITTLVLGLIAWQSGVFKYNIRSRDKLIIFIRSICEALTAYFFLTAVMNLPFANVTAILQILPITVALSAVFVFKEKIGVFRGLAIFLGFLGVLLIIQPQTNNFNFYSLYALIAVLLVTIRDLLTRGMSDEVPSMLPTFFSSLFVLIFACIFVPSIEMQKLDALGWLWVALSAFFIIFGYYTAVLVMRSGEISFISPFRYSAILFALIFGIVVFGEIPNLSATIGIAVVAFAGIFLLYRANSLKE